MIDAGAPATEDDAGEAHNAPAAFDNIETGVLERDLATHEKAPINETDEGEVLDLGRVEGLSAAPSTLRAMVGSAEAAGVSESDTMEKPD